MLELASDDPALADTVACFYHAAGATTSPATLHYRFETAGGGRYLGLAPGKPPFGPDDRAAVFAFLEWRATADLLAGAGPDAFLHAAGANLGHHPVLIIGAPGSGKSTTLAHLFAAGNQIWGDDLVRFASETMTFSAMPRSLKLDDNSLKSLDLIRTLAESKAAGTLLAPEWCYISPAAVRSDWAAPPGRPAAVVMLDQRRHAGNARLEPMSAAQAAVQVTETVIGQRADARRREGLAVRVLESLGDTKAYAAGGNDPADLAALIAARLG